MAAPRRAPLVVALCAFAAFYSLSLYTTGVALFGEGPGFVFFDNLTAEPSVGMVPLTEGAVRSVEGMQGVLRVLSVDGVDTYELPGTSSYAVRVRTAALATDRTRFVVQDERDERRTVEVEDGRHDLSFMPGVVYVGFAYQLVGLFYLAVGLLVWGRRPADPSAPWLLGLGLIAATHLCQPAPDQPLGWILNTYVAAAMLPLYGPIVVGLVRAFTGVRGGVGLTRARRTVTVAALALTVVVPLMIQTWLESGHGVATLRVYVFAVGAELAVAIGVVMWIAGQAMRRSRPPAVRRRARLLAVATGLSFGLPTLELVLVPFIDAPPLEIVVPNLVCFAAFPVIIGYAILRYQAFDLRIAIRRGVVYAVLSLLVSLAFVGVVLLLVDRVGDRAQSPAALWVTSMVLVVGVGLLQLRVQAIVDRWAHRKRERYARGIAEVSEELARAHSLDALSKTAARALIEVMGLSRAYVAMRSGDDVDCLLLANHDDPQTGRAPEEVPARLDLRSTPPLARAAELEEMTTAYDPDALPSLEGAKPLAATFWADYGLEVVVPLLRTVEGSRTVIGFLLLGPRLDGQPLDDQDRALVRQLANQLTVAAENTLAFEQIRALKEGLEDKVKARTRELEQALAELEDAEVQIIETAKQAMLGRLVAGIVHEVNTPLGALRSSADTMQRILTKLDDELPEGAPSRRRIEVGKELAALQITSVTRLSDLMDSLKCFVSLDEADLQEVDVREGIDSALRLLSHDIADEVRIVRDYPAEIPRIRAHAQRLNQVFLHVLQNAVHAIDGEGEIAVEVRRREGGGVSVVVRDDGPGIPEERRADLFEFGFTKKGGRMGLRLGLPSSARTVRELGGELRVDTTVGEGTAVHIELPGSGASR